MLYKRATTGYYQLAFVVMFGYTVITLLSVLANRKHRNREVILRCSTLIRAAARHAMRAKQACARGDYGVWVYLDALRAKVYNDCVQLIAGNDNIAEMLGIDLDAFAVVVDQLLDKCHASVEACNLGPQPGNRLAARQMFNQ